MAEVWKRGTFGGEEIAPFDLIMMIEDGDVYVTQGIAQSFSSEYDVHIIEREDKNELSWKCIMVHIWRLCVGTFVAACGVPVVHHDCGHSIGRQCFKFAGLTFFPFGKEIEYGGGAVSMIANIFWLIFTGIPMALANAVWGCVLCITIIGIPFGKQFFKFAKLALMPFGAVVK